MHLLRFSSSNSSSNKITFENERKRNFPLLKKFAVFLNSCTAEVGVGRMLKSGGKVARKGFVHLNVLRKKPAPNYLFFFCGWGGG